ncbi:MAG: hypothetical protein WD845_01455 [Pirellulales bacterium]
MNDRSLAIHILQNARDRLSERLTRRIVEAREEIESDAEGGSYLSEIETIYDQLGSRLAHVNGMLANLPPAPPNEPGADATATEIIYADLASAYPTGFELEGTLPPMVLGLPAPANSDERVDPLADAVCRLATLGEAGDCAAMARLMSESFDLKPSRARRWAASFARQIATRPDLPRRLIDLAVTIDHVSEHSAGALVAECFESEPFEAQAIVRALKRRGRDDDLGS